MRRERTRGGTGGARRWRWLIVDVITAYEMIIRRERKNDTCTQKREEEKQTYHSENSIFGEEGTRFHTSEGVGELVLSMCVSFFSFYTSER